ncbi:glycosyltransferase family 4 protein [Patescibacteria group bacterium]|nr:glycosyltransferase family 4 protein [Patescibacteria group bacterium]
MLIGIDASRANRSHKSGTEWYSYYLIRWLAKLDKDNQYILYTDQPLTGGLLDLTTQQHFDDKNRAKEEAANFDKDGCRILKSPYNNFKAKVLKWPFNFLWTQVRFSWEMLIHRPDILFIPSHTLPRIHPKKSIITIHDIAFERERLLYSNGYLGPESAFYRKIVNLLVKLCTFGKYRASTLDYHSWAARFALKHAKKIITVSNFSKKEIEEVYNVKEKKIKVIHNGYNKSLYNKINDQNGIKEVLDKYGIDAPYIFYVGRLEKKKNTPALVEAYAVMREEYKNIKHKLVLVGDASHGFDEVKYIIREFNLDDDVIITGWAPEADMPYIYSGAAAIVHPSLYEGSSIPLLQAMACGTAITASQTTSIPEVAGDAALFFNPRDVRSIADAMAKIILDNELRQKLIENGFERVKNFSWQKCAEETLKEIRNL